MNIYLNDRYLQYQERKQSLEAMPASEGRTELLRNYIRDLEADILKIVGNPNEFSDLVKRTAPSKIREVSHMLMYRCWALNTMFYDHCSNTEIKQFAVINELSDFQKNFCPLLLVCAFDFLNNRLDIKAAGTVMVRAIL